MYTPPEGGDRIPTTEGDVIAAVTSNRALPDHEDRRVDNGRGGLRPGSHVSRDVRTLPASRHSPGFVDGERRGDEQDQQGSASVPHELNS
jgi:hypothetical protein